MIALVFLLALAAATAAPAASVQDQAHDDLWRDVTTGCGQSKSCFLFPQDCYMTKECVLGVSVLVTGVAPNTKYTFEAQSIGGVYISVGLSNDKEMNGTSVVECVSDAAAAAEDKLSIYTSYNKGTTNDREPTPDANIELLDSSYDKDKMIARCTFTRKEVTTYQAQEFDLSKTAYFMILAAGKAADENSIGYHDVAMKYSANQRFLADIGFFELPA